MIEKYENMIIKCARLKRLHLASEALNGFAGYANEDKSLSQATRDVLNVFDSSGLITRDKKY